MESSKEDLQAWESFQRDFEESKEKDKIEGTYIVISYSITCT